MVTIVAVSDGVDRKTKNNLASASGRSSALFFAAPNYSLKSPVCPCTVGKWAVSITSSTCC